MDSSNHGNDGGGDGDGGTNRPGYLEEMSPVLLTSKLSSLEVWSWDELERMRARARRRVQEQAEKERAEKERIEKERAEKERAEKERAKKAEAVANAKKAQELSAAKSVPKIGESGNTRSFPLKRPVANVKKTPVSVGKPSTAAQQQAPTGGNRRLYPGAPPPNQAPEHVVGYENLELSHRRFIQEQAYSFQHALQRQQRLKSGNQPGPGNAGYGQPGGAVTLRGASGQFVPRNQSSVAQQTQQQATGPDSAGHGQPGKAGTLGNASGQPVPWSQSFMAQQTRQTSNGGSLELYPGAMGPIQASGDDFAGYGQPERMVGSWEGPSQTMQNYQRRVAGFYPNLAFPPADQMREYYPDNLTKPFPGQIAGNYPAHQTGSYPGSTARYYPAQQTGSYPGSRAGSYAGSSAGYYPAQQPLVQRSGQIISKGMAVYGDKYVSLSPQAGYSPAQPSMQQRPGSGMQGQTFKPQVGRQVSYPQSRPQQLGAIGQPTYQQPQEKLPNLATIPAYYDNIADPVLRQQKINEYMEEMEARRDEPDEFELQKQAHELRIANTVVISPPEDRVAGSNKQRSAKQPGGFSNYTLLNAPGKACFEHPRCRKLHVPWATSGELVVCGCMHRCEVCGKFVKGPAHALRVHVTNNHTGPRYKPTDDPSERILYLSVRAEKPLASYPKTLRKRQQMRDDDGELSEEKLAKVKAKRMRTAQRNKNHYDWQKQVHEDLKKAEEEKKAQEKEELRQRNRRRVAEMKAQGLLG